MRYLFLKIQLLLFVLCVMASCSDSNDEPTVQEPFLEITPSGGEEISSEGGKLTLTVKSNVDWEVTSDQYWCKVTAGDALTGNQALGSRGELVAKFSSGYTQFYLFCYGRISYQ